jgi:small subunit ribosomal protein S4
MGDPKFNRKKYSNPSHPWQADRIKAEKELQRKYGLKNKREIWKAQAELRRYRRHARKLQAKLRYGDPQAVKESQELIAKLTKLGILQGEEIGLDDILSLNVEAILSRRLQTIVYLRGMANTPEQARQFIVHGHIAINGRKITVPSYHVTKAEESLITYHYNSPLADELHPERTKKQKKIERMEKAEEKRPEVAVNG